MTEEHAERLELALEAHGFTMREAGRLDTYHNLDAAKASSAALRAIVGVIVSEECAAVLSERDKCILTLAETYRHAADAYTATRRANVCPVVPRCRLITCPACVAVSEAYDAMGLASSDLNSAILAPQEPADARS